MTSGLCVGDAACRHRGGCGDIGAVPPPGHALSTLGKKCKRDQQGQHERNYQVTLWTQESELNMEEPNKNDFHENFQLTNCTEEVRLLKSLFVVHAHHLVAKLASSLRTGGIHAWSLGGMVGLNKHQTKKKRFAERTQNAKRTGPSAAMTRTPKSLLSEHPL